MRDREGFPNPYDFEREEQMRQERERRNGRERRPRSRDEMERHDREREERQPRRFGRYYGRFGDFGTASPYAGYTGFGGPGWTAGGYGDPGYNTSGFGAVDYGTSRYGSGTYEGSTARRLDPDVNTSYPVHLERGPHAGKGPKGYRRSDATIIEDVVKQLTRHPEIDASDLQVVVDDATVTLTGSVEERRQKWMAEDVIEEVPGVRHIENRIRVARRGR